MDSLSVIVTCILIQKCVAFNSACPSDCTCERYPAGWKSISCTHLHLTGVPADTDLPVKLWNLSYNKIVEIDGKSTDLPREIETLDVSHNHIEKLQEIPSTVSVLNASHNLLSKIPELPRFVTVVKLSHNRIMTLHTSHICSLPRLRSMFLTNNKIRKVVTNSEVKECHIEYLILSNNKIDHVDAKTFSVFKNLKSLDLSRNYIKSVETGTFFDFTALKYLSLSQNRITSLPQNLPIMEWFDISENRIVEISEDHRSDLYPQEVFLIGQNPFHCDCELLWLKELFDTKKYQLQYHTIDADQFVPQCDTPDLLSGERWDTLTNDNFRCVGETKSTNEEEDNNNRLEDLKATVDMTGANFITVEWNLENVKTDRSSDMVLIKIHPFGKKLQRRFYSVNADRKKYTIKSLIPQTQYIICTLVFVGKPSQAEVSRYEGSCLEVATTSDNNIVVTSVMKTIFRSTAILVVCMIALKIITKRIRHMIHAYKKKNKKKYN